MTEEQRASEREASRRYYNKTKPYQKSRSRAYRDANPDWWREVKRRRRALEQAATVLDFPVSGLEGRLALYHHRCWICKSKPWEHWDHVKPLAKGGLHILANLRPACRECNQRKGATWPFDPMTLRN